MQVLNAMQMKSGKKAEYNRMGSITQPLQFLSKKDKNPEWTAWNLDWLEWNGLKQIRRNARRLMKNYKLAKGTIDKTDYLVEADNEMRDIVDSLAQEDASALELKFYPIIPNVVNVLVAEFAKRNTKITFRGVDEYSHNEMLEEKRSQIEQVLMQQAEQKLMAKNKCNNKLLQKLLNLYQEYKTFLIKVIKAYVNNGLLISLRLMKIDLEWMNLRKEALEICLLLTVSSGT